MVLPKPVEHGTVHAHEHGAKLPPLPDGPIFLRADKSWITKLLAPLELPVNYLVTKELLDLHDKYDGDLGLLDERWAAKGDGGRFSSEQIRTLSEYIEQVRLRQLETLSPELKRTVEHRIGELESLIAPDVITTLQERLC
jgi:hypothetical protein